MLPNFKPSQANNASVKLRELTATLSTLGFKKSQIELALAKIEVSNDLDKMIEDSIQIIAAAQSQVH